MRDQWYKREPLSSQIELKIIFIVHAAEGDSLLLLASAEEKTKNTWRGNNARSSALAIIATPSGNEICAAASKSENNLIANFCISPHNSHTAK